MKSQKFPSKRTLSLADKGHFWMSDPHCSDSDLSCFCTEIKLYDYIIHLMVQIDGDLNLVRFAHDFKERSNIKGLLEGLGFLMKNKGPSAISGITYRELENFLRDANHVPALEKDYSGVMIIRDEVLYGMLLAFIKLQRGSIFNIRKMWDKTSYIEKIEILKEIFKELNLVLEKIGRSVEFLHFQKQVIYLQVYGEKNQTEKTAITRVIKDCLEMAFNTQHIQLNAEE